jgi:hypothetical protein
VKCRSCGTEIADKALICYRCGTATTEATFKPAAPRRSSATLIATAVAIVLLALLALYLGRIDDGGTSRVYSWLAVAAGVAIAGIRAYLRRRRR